MEAIHNKTLFVFIAVLSSLNIYSQNKSPHTQSKRPIDTIDINNWQSLGTSPNLSNDGKYILYNIQNKPLRGNTLVIQSTVDNWKQELPNISKAFICKDSRSIAFLQADTFYIATVRGKRMAIVNNVKNITYISGEKSEWIAVETRDEQRELILFNPSNQEEQRFENVIEFKYDTSGQVILIKTFAVGEQGNCQSLKMVNLHTKNQKTIWQYQKNIDQLVQITEFMLDNSGQQAAFITEKVVADSSIKMNHRSYSLWYYRIGMQAPVNKLTDSININEQTLYVDKTAPFFSEDGNYIYFILYQPLPIRPTYDPVSVDVWNYQDTVLKSFQISELKIPAYYAVVSVNNNHIIQLTADNEVVSAYSSKGDYSIVTTNNLGDKVWLPDSVKRKLLIYWLVSLKDGSRQNLNLSGEVNFYFSPSGNYLVYFHSTDSGSYYYSYDLSTALVTNISSTIPKNSLAYKDDYLIGDKAESSSPPVGIAGWRNDDTSIIVYDNYDVWELFYGTLKPPFNVTNGFGALNKIKLRLTYGSDRQEMVVTFDTIHRLFLTAYSPETKFNGFLTTKLGAHQDPKVLILGPWKFDHTRIGLFTPNDFESDKGMAPIKAKNADVWIIERQSATEPPGYFVTRNFKLIKPVASVKPHENVNWLTSELISWKRDDGLFDQAILYRPENFNSNNRYPVIFIYYQQLTQLLFEFPAPDYTHSYINVPWFVSHGYIVCLVDILFKVGSYGKSALDAVEGAANYLKKFPWIDPSKLGLNGHSFGGFETNYIISHSNMFNAALEGAGVSDQVSSYLGLSLDGSRLTGTERNMGANLWKEESLYLENSPILSADKIETPLLINHSKSDYAVPWEQGIALFLALRRLNKPVWLLQYDQQPHYNDGEAAVDFTVRVTQFFDHFLKNAAIPEWMDKGIPAKFKGIKKAYN